MVTSCVFKNVRCGGRLDFPVLSPSKTLIASYLIVLYTSKRKRHLFHWTLCGNEEIRASHVTEGPPDDHTLCSSSLAEHTFICLKRHQSEVLHEARYSKPHQDDEVDCYCKSYS